MNLPCPMLIRFHEAHPTAIVQAMTRVPALFLVLCALNCATPQARPESFATLEPPASEAGYLARLLINESPFPGEKGYLSEADTRNCMLAILWAVHSRIHFVPEGYRQEQIAAVKTDDVFDVITAGGERGQCDGFYRDAQGKLAAVPRVEQRVQYLLKIANSGGKPGKFAGLLNYAQGLSNAYLEGGIEEADRFAGIRSVDQLSVTGRGYSWMTDRDYYSPGGNFVRIPNDMSGSLGGNRFFTLKEL